MIAPTIPIPHPERAPAAFRLKVLIVWAVLCAVSLAVNWDAIARVTFPDPDDLLRLQQVRDWMAGQSWFDLHQYRMMAPQGVAMHWSRLIDPPIAAVIALARPLIGQYAAELIAMTAVPLLALGSVTALAMHFARRMFGEEVGLMAGFVVGMSIPLQHQLRPLRIDHHGWQIVMAIIALGAIFSQRPRVGGAIAGLALAFWLAISIEGLPMAIAIMGLFALRWLRDPRDCEWLRWGMSALATGSIALWFAWRHPSQLGTQLCDVVSSGHLTALGVAAAGCVAATRIARAQFAIRLALLGASGLCAFAALWLIAPACIGGDAFASLSPGVRSFWYERVHEGLPLWHQHLGVAVQVLAVPAIALVALGGLYRAAVDRSGKAMWLDYALLVGAALAVAIMVERASATAAAIAAPAAALQIRKWLDRAQTLSLKPMQVLAMLGALLLLVPSMPVLLAVKVARPEQGVKESAVRAALKCQDPANLYALDRLPAADILSPLDTGPSLIYATHHRIVASGHHRGNGGMRDIIEAFMASPDKARAIARRRGIEYVAFCPGLSEPDLYIKESSDGLMAQLSAGKQVSWLEPVQVPGVRSLKIYRVEP